MHVRIYHNVACDDRGRRINSEGYQPEHPLVLVFDAALDDGDTTVASVPEAIFEACNLDAGHLTGWMRSLALAYRDRHLRSLSVGDVIVLDGDASTALAVAPSGFSAVPAARLDITIDDEPGTEPWPVNARPAQVLAAMGTEAERDERA